MSPLPAWLAGAQHVCMNFSANDVSVQLHFALFNGHGGFVLKPKEMRGGSSRRASAERGNEQLDDDNGWPPPRKFLQCIAVHAISLHNLPKVCGRCTHPELRGQQSQRLLW
eukprot:1356949-Prymnesium_polylepis.1